MKRYKHILLCILWACAFPTVVWTQQDTVKMNPIVGDTLVISKDSTHVISNSSQALAGNIPNDTAQSSKPISDTTAAKKSAYYQPQLRLLLDIGNLAVNFLDPTRMVIDVSADYHYKNNWYLVAEGGYAQGNIDFSYLQYQTNSYYIRFGGDKSLLQPISKRDLDAVFFGFRYGMAFGNRGEANFVVPSQFGPSRSGSMEAQSFWVHWGEMTGGIRVEMWKGIYAGWNFRARFLLNGKTFDDKLAPNYIAGYGKGDNTTSFGFNVYLGYAIRWQKKML